MKKSMDNCALFNGQATRQQMKCSPTICLASYLGLTILLILYIRTRSVELEQRFISYRPIPALTYFVADTLNSLQVQ